MNAAPASTGSQSEQDGLRIALVEDDPFHAELYRGWLENGGYRVSVYRSAAEFRRRLGAESVDAVVLDWNLPDASGLDLLHWLKSSAAPSLPVLFLTANDSEEDVVAALRAGAADFVSKPARAAELAARIEAMLRRSGREKTSRELTAAPFSLDARVRRLSIDGQPVKLTEREFELAWYLFGRSGRIVSREALLSEVWRTAGDVSTRTIDTHMSRLRRKLGLDGRHGWRLAAVYQLGYRLEPPIEGAAAPAEEGA